MLSKIRNRKEEGFTIIEVLIVLAIAGLILLVVFLAVPALQRNARNNEARNEASRFATSANEWVANNGGGVPVSQTDADAIKAAAGTTRQLTTLTYGAGATGVGQARITLGTCVGNVATPAFTRTMAVQYGLEPAGTQACVQI